MGNREVTHLAIITKQDRQKILFHPCYFSAVLFPLVLLTPTGVASIVPLVPFVPGLSLLASAGTLLIRSPMRVPLSNSKRAGTWATMLTISPVRRLAPIPALLSLAPVETMVTLSTLLRGSAMARTI